MRKLWAFIKVVGEIVLYVLTAASVVAGLAYGWRFFYEVLPDLLPLRVQMAVDGGGLLTLVYALAAFFLALGCAWIAGLPMMAIMALLNWLAEVARSITSRSQ